MQKAGHPLLSKKHTDFIKQYNFTGFKRAETAVAICNTHVANPII